MKLIEPSAPASKTPDEWAAQFEKAARDCEIAAERGRQDAATHSRQALELRALAQWLRQHAAQGIEAGTGETRQGLDPKGESPVAEGHAPLPLPVDSPSSDGEG